MALLTPDMAGFAAAQESLYTYFGVPVDFLIPVPTVYDPSVPISNFGDPLDAFAVPVAGGARDFTTVTQPATVVNRPFGGRGQVKDTSTGLTPAGRLGDSELGLHILPATYALVGPEGSEGEATRLEFWNVRYEIRQWRPGGVGSLLHYEVYIQEEGGL
jgi:hypothetical protein